MDTDIVFVALRQVTMVLDSTRLPCSAQLVSATLVGSIGGTG